MLGLYRANRKENWNYYIVYWVFGCWVSGRLVTLGLQVYEHYSTPQLGTPVVPFFHFFLGGLLIQTEHKEKGYPFFYGGDWGT